jgi:hypothetical protein
MFESLVQTPWVKTLCVPSDASLNVKPRNLLRSFLHTHGDNFSHILRTSKIIIMLRPFDMNFLGRGSVERKRVSGDVSQYIYIINKKYNIFIIKLIGTLFKKPRLFGNSCDPLERRYRLTSRLAGTIRLILLESCSLIRPFYLYD